MRSRCHRARRGPARDRQSTRLRRRRQEIRLWPGQAPGSESWTIAETTTTSPAGDRTIANVSEPTLTVFLPDAAAATGAAVVVAPGGALRVLGWDNEGVKVRAMAERQRYRGIRAEVPHAAGAARKRPGAGGATAGGRGAAAAPRQELEIRNANANPGARRRGAALKCCGWASPTRSRRCGCRAATPRLARSIRRASASWGSPPAVASPSALRSPSARTRRRTFLVSLYGPSLHGRQRAGPRAAALHRSRGDAFQRDQRLPGAVRRVEGGGQAGGDPRLRPGERRLRDVPARPAGR